VVGRFIYSIGLNAGTNVDIRPTQSAYLHVGTKIGGMRLDGEKAGIPNPMRPWEETALTLDAYGYREQSRFTTTFTPAGATAATTTDDEAWIVGGHARLQLRSFELDAGGFHEWHDQAALDSTTGAGINAHAFSVYGEASYVVYPWFVPALRVEWFRLSPEGQTPMNDVKIVPGIAGLILPNLKLVLSAQFEWGNGNTPAGTWAPAGGSVTPPLRQEVIEIETIQLTLAYAF
jgi:hypothetical protein